ncbi:MAG: ATP-binding cassette domain-containing protein [Vicinamibacterales bacterium]
MPTSTTTSPRRNCYSYFASLFGLAGQARTRRVTSLLDEVGIGAERRLQLRKFSKGMLQRVGIAQALLNEPDLVIFDEPMSGLDPLGRRDVRALILRLRNSGCTVFFSSHVLSDAEALCSRVAILAKGRLITTGRLADILAFQIRGWEVVASGVSSTLAASLAPRTTTATRVGDDRYVFDLPVDSAPDRFVPDLSAARRHPAVGESDSRHARGLLREAGHRAGRGVAQSRTRRARRRRGSGPMTRQVGVIALNVFRESVRDKVLYNLVSFAILLMAASYLVGQLTAGQDVKMVSRTSRSLPLATFGLLIAIFIGIGLVSKEVENREHLQPAGEANPAERSSSLESTSASS